MRSLLLYLKFAARSRPGRRRRRDGMEVVQWNARQSVVRPIPGSGKSTSVGLCCEPSSEAASQLLSNCALCDQGKSRQPAAGTRARRRASILIHFLRRFAQLLPNRRPADLRLAPEPGFASDGDTEWVRAPLETFRVKQSGFSISRPGASLFLAPPRLSNSTAIAPA